MKRITCVLLTLAFVIAVFSCSAFAAIETDKKNTEINLQELSIDELLELQNEIKQVLADKGYVKYEELDRGSKGEEVSDVQERLKELGYYSGSLSGKYDSETQKAFKQFEKNNNLESDGKASQYDLVILFSSTAEAKTTPTPAPEKEEKAKKTTEEVPEGYLPFTDFDYTEFFRYPEKYYGTKIVLKGKVLQVLGTRSSGYEIRLATAGSDDVVYVRVPFDPGFNILENDRLTVYAEMRNPFTYTSTFRNSVTIPSANADSIKLN